MIHNNYSFTLRSTLLACLVIIGSQVYATSLKDIRFLKGEDIQLDFSALASEGRIHVSMPMYLEEGDDEAWQDLDFRINQPNSSYLEQLFTLNPSLFVSENGKNVLFEKEWVQPQKSDYYWVKFSNYSPSNNRVTLKVKDDKTSATLVFTPNSNAYYTAQDSYWYKHTMTVYFKSYDNKLRARGEFDIYPHLKALSYYLDTITRAVVEDEWEWMRYGHDRYIYIFPRMRIYGKDQLYPSDIKIPFPLPAYQAPTFTLEPATDKPGYMKLIATVHPFNDKGHFTDLKYRGDIAGASSVAITSQQYTNGVYTAVGYIPVDEFNGYIWAEGGFAHHVSEYAGFLDVRTTKLPWGIPIYTIYQQAQDFTAENLINGDTRLTWRIDELPEDYRAEQFRGDAWEIQRSTDSLFLDADQVVTLTHVPFNPAQTHYELKDLTSEDNLNGKVFYRIRRTYTASTWGWEYCQRTDCDKTITHQRIRQAAIEMDTLNRVTLWWRLNELSLTVAQSANSKVVIRRINMDDNNSSEEILRAITDSLYSEELTLLCNKFRYEVFVRPGSDAYDDTEVVQPIHLNALTHEPLSDGVQYFIPTQMARMRSVTGSKGYFSDRVEIQWTISNGGVENFIISRREYGSGDAFRQIHIEPAYAASNEYTYDDRTALAGVVYEYQIVGTNECSGTVITNDPLKDIGFRTPTGDFYGKVTYQNTGNAVPNCEIRLHCEDSIPTYALHLQPNSLGVLTINPLSHSPFSLQAYIRPEISTNRIVEGRLPLLQHILYIKGMVDMGITTENGFYQLYVQLPDGTRTLATDTLPFNQYAQVTAAIQGNTVSLFVNGEPCRTDTRVLPLHSEELEHVRDSIRTLIYNELTTRQSPLLTLMDADELTLIGGNYNGYIDELRMWSIALDSTAVANNYARYIVGNESGLEAYYTFNYMVDNAFYDMAYTGTHYHAYHGLVYNGTRSTITPSSEQLSYRGYTTEEGNYTIRAVPYFGNGSAYTLVPRKGIHQFTPVEEVRFINASSPAHTVNFMDKSSFKVSGRVTYASFGESTYPVEGVMFYIDGTPTFNADGYITTDENGAFTIDVPVGTHAVRMEKLGHHFENDGYITDPWGNDLNYQDQISGLELHDLTTVKYIGRIVGGTAQSALPIGLCLSHNNLSDDMSVTLRPLKYAYIVRSDTTLVEQHPYTARDSLTQLNRNTNNVHYSQDGITIDVNNKTGEFIAHILPEQYVLSLQIPPAAGYQTDDMEGNNTIQDFIIRIDTTYFNHTQYTDTTDSLSRTYLDSIGYQYEQCFTLRVRPTLRLQQLGRNNKPLPYFGTDSIRSSDALGNTTVCANYIDSTDSYYFGSPVFVQNQQVSFMADLYENYVHYPSGKSDQINLSDVDFEIHNGFDAARSVTKLHADSTGIATYQFTVGEPNMATATALLSASASYGDDTAPTSIPWQCPFAITNDAGDLVTQVYIMGVHKTGNDFVTAGPDKILTVVRDPPGSRSYAYLAEGVTFTENSTYTGSMANNGTETWTNTTGTKIEFEQAQIDFLTGIGVINCGTSSIDIYTEKDGITHSETYTGGNTKTGSTTTTTKFATSADPNYVGADGDVYVGYSTNITFSDVHAVQLMSRDEYITRRTQIETVYTDTLKEYLLVKRNASSVFSTFATLFAYAQAHVEHALLPELRERRNQFLTVSGDSAALQQQANDFYALTGRDTAFYLSKVAVDHEHFGDSGYYVFIHNIDTIHLNMLRPTHDTLLTINQWINNWEQRLADNERIKLESKNTAETFVQNYSFAQGATVDYSERYATGKNFTNTFNISVGMTFNHSNTVLTQHMFEYGNLLSFTENTLTTHGGTFGSSTERNHTKGFVLSEDGLADHLSVDVRREKNWTPDSEQYNPDGSGGMVDSTDIAEKDYYSSFVFIVRGGATSCPWESGTVTKYYQPGTVIDEPTIQVQKPVLNISPALVENVPSGEKAYFTLTMLNDSEAEEDQYYKLVLSNNEDGAIVTIDGINMATGPVYLVPYGSTGLVKTLCVEKGRALKYDNLKLVLASTCQADPTAYYKPIVSQPSLFSVHYTPSCSKIEIISPNDGWTYNTKTRYLPITIGSFDRNYADFERIVLQFKPASASEEEWITLHEWIKDTLILDDAGQLHYNWYAESIVDGAYDLRALTYCKINNVRYDNPSAVVSGVKDMLPPRLFGEPKPANGILNAGDEIGISFNESIHAGWLTSDNFVITGVRNGARSDHQTAITLNGTTDRLLTEAKVNLSNRSFTMEGWFNPAEEQDAVILRHNQLTIGISKDKHLVFSNKDQSIRSERALDLDTESWNHIALVYDAQRQVVSGYLNYVELITFDAEIADSEAAPLIVGETLHGSVDDVRLWTTAREALDIEAVSAQRLSGREPGLLWYYPMEEGRGTYTADKAHGAKLYLEGATWNIPEGRSIHVNEKTYAALNISMANILHDQDFTLELWFKGDAEQANATIVCTGDGIHDVDDPNRYFSIGLDANGRLILRSAGSETQCGFLDKLTAWHQLTLAVSRSLGHARLFIDGELRATRPASEMGWIETDSLYLGTRAYYGDSIALNKRLYDQPFNGLIDEVRLWNTCRPQQVITQQFNTQVQGSEPGLRLYFPFEHYITSSGIQWMDFDSTDRVSGMQATGLISTNNQAPVRIESATAKLEYSYVVNNDAINITLTEDPYRIENTIVQFAVQDVQDLNGNILASPITWSAYINRHTLRWEKNEIILTLNRNELNANGIIHMDILNHAGSIQNWHIEGLPEWLSISESKGTLDPLDSKTLTLQINTSLAVGTYDEVLYLVSDDNMSDALTLHISMEGEVPEWTVNPADFLYSASIFAQVRINGQLSSDERDILAVFLNGNCVGVTMNTYYPEKEMYYFLLTLYANTRQVTEDDLQFRFYDASTGIVHEVEADTTNVIFRHNGIIGSPSEPLIFTPTDRTFVDYNLEKGWNWVSFGMEARHLEDINLSLRGNEWNGAIIKDLLSFAAYSSEKKQWQGTLTSISNKNMYMLYIPIPIHFAVSGKLLDPAADAARITLEPKQWNYIAYIPQQYLAVSEAFAHLSAHEGDVVKSLSAFAIYNDNHWIGSLAALQPNAGYMYYNASDQPVAFNYPSGAHASMPHHSIQASLSGNNMTMVATLEDEGSENIFAYIDDELVGNAARMDSLCFITISSDAVGSPIEFRTEDGGVLTPSPIYIPDCHLGSPQNPIRLKLIQEETPYKIIENNHIIIIRNYEKYDITGRKME